MVFMVSILGRGKTEARTSNFKTERGNLQVVHSGKTLRFVHTMAHDPAVEHWANFNLGRLGPKLISHGVTLNKADSHKDMLLKTLGKNEFRFTVQKTQENDPYLRAVMFHSLEALHDTALFKAIAGLDRKTQQKIASVLNDEIASMVPSKGDDLKQLRAVWRKRAQ